LQKTNIEKRKSV
ncbi:60 kDa chaperonin, partial [Chlamydia psittaci 84-8471/1]